MTTAQMTQTAPRMVNDVHPPAAPTQQGTSTEIEIVNDMPVQSQAAPKSIGFKPIMSAEHHDPAKTTASDHVLSEASHAVQTEHQAEPAHAKTKAPSAAGPKPILETILLVIGCIVACGVVLVMFSSN